MVLNRLQPASKTDFAWLVLTRLELDTLPTKIAAFSLTSSPLRELMQLLLALVSDSGADGFAPLFLIGTLGNRQLLLQCAVVSHCDLLAIGDRHHILTA